jgi:hypothetical protein
MGSGSGSRVGVGGGGLAAAAGLSAPVDAVDIADAVDAVGSVELLLSGDVAGLSQQQRVAALVAVAEQRSRLEAREVELLAAVAAGDRSPEQWCREEVGAALRWSPWFTAVRMNQASVVCASLPATLAALRGGRISGAHAAAVSSAAQELPVGLHAGLEARVVARAGAQSLAQLRRSLRRAVLALDPRSAAAKYRAAVAERTVRISDAEHGMQWLSALLPAPDAQACLAAIDRYARTPPPTTTDTDSDGRGGSDTTGNDTTGGSGSGSGSGGDTDSGADGGAGRSTLAQRRADVFLAALLTGLTPDTHAASDTDEDGHTGHTDEDGHTGQDGQDGRSGRSVRGGGGPVRPPRRPQIQVIVAASTLLHQDDEPGWLEHYGPIHADLARELAHDPTGSWRRLLTDPTTGQLLDYARTTYTPPRHLHDYITARDGTCTFPTCTISAQNADLDHIVAYPHGPTSHHNLTAAHRRHHNAKTHGGWTIHLDPDTGHITWTSPHGRRYHHHPPERWHTPHPQPTTAATPESPDDDPTGAEPTTVTATSKSPDDDCPF